MHEDLIYDVGMHKGEDTEYYLIQGFRVVGIEANPILAKECAIRFLDAIDNGRLCIIDRALVSIDDSTIDFFVNDDLSVWGTASRDWDERNKRLGTTSHRIRVDTISIGRVVSEHGMPYYMKIDIEGLDLVCMEGLLAFQERPKFISAESSATSMRDTFKQLRLLDRLGYTKFKVVPQAAIGLQPQWTRDRQGREFKYIFESGSSGPFGDDAPGQWQSLWRTKWDYCWYHFCCRLVGSHNGVLRGRKGKWGWRLLEGLFSRGTNWYDTHASY